MGRRFCPLRSPCNYADKVVHVGVVGTSSPRPDMLWPIKPFSGYCKSKKDQEIADGILADKTSAWAKRSRRSSGFARVFTVISPHKMTTMDDIGK